MTDAGNMNWTAASQRSHCHLHFILLY